MIPYLKFGRWTLGQGGLKITGNVKMLDLELTGIKNVAMTKGRVVKCHGNVMEKMS